MNKRAFGRYALAGSLTLLYAGAAWQAYTELGSTPLPNDMTKLKKVTAMAGALAALTWVVAAL